MLAYARGMGLNHNQGIKTHVYIVFKYCLNVKFIFFLITKQPYNNSTISGH